MDMKAIKLQDISIKRERRTGFRRTVDGSKVQTRKGDAKTCSISLETFLRMFNDETVELTIIESSRGTTNQRTTEMLFSFLRSREKFDNFFAMSAVLKRPQTLSSYSSLTIVCNDKAVLARRPTLEYRLISPLFAFFVFRGGNKWR